MSAIVNTTTLGKAVLYSLLTGVGIAVVFAVGVSSAASLLDALRERRTAAGVAWGALALVSVTATAVAIVAGVVVMTQKG
jgi:hypothetical protein